MQFGDDLRARLRTLPAVRGVTFSSRHPADQGMRGPVEAEGQPAAGWYSAAWAFQEAIAPGFFRALGIRLAAGREFGVRCALGAVRRDILVLVMRQTSVQLLVGVSGGLALGWVLPRVVRAQPRLVSALEPWHAALAVGVVSLTAFIAVWLPTRRAAKMNPVDALRAE